MKSLYVVGMLLIAGSLLVGCGYSAEMTEDPLFQQTDDIYVAAERGDTELVRAFMVDGVWDHNSTNVDGILPLGAAAKGGNAEIIGWMVEHGADVNAKDLNGKTAMQYAEEAGHQEAVQLLQQLGATS